MLIISLVQLRIDACKRNVNQNKKTRTYTQREPSTETQNKTYTMATIAFANNIINILFC